MTATANIADVSQLRNQQLAPREAQMPAVRAGFFDLQSFELMQRIAKGFAASTLVPKEYQGNVANCMIALNLAQRINGDPLMVMQNLVIVHGRPTWSAQYLIATANMCGRFSAIRFEFFGERNTDDWGCRAWAMEKGANGNNEKLIGAEITIGIAKKEGWYGKNGSKWQSIPQQMLMYRAGSWWVRAYAPELSMGLMTADEAHDVFDATQGADGSYSVDLSSLQAAAGQEQVDTTTGEITRAANDQGDSDLRQLEQQEPTRVPAAKVQQPEPVAQGQSDGPTFQDAVAEVNAGNFDLARDIARSLPEGQQQAIETAITNKQGGNAGGRRGRGDRLSMNLE